MTGAVCVTGAGGYIGGRLVRHLQQSAGCVVRPVVRNPVPWLPDASRLDLARADAGSITTAFAGCRAVVHLAGSSEVLATRDPDGAIANTVAAARRAAVGAAAAGVHRFVYVSTVHVYGAALGRHDRIDEATLPEPRHPYAIGRLAGEHLAASAGPDALVVLRLTNSVGAPVDERVDRWSLVANELCAQAATGGPLVLRSSGRQWRDFVDLGDVCRAIEAAALGDVPVGTYNLGTGTSRTVLDLAELVADVAAPIVGARPRVEAPAHEGPVPAEVIVDVSRLAAHVPAPAVPLEDSLRELVELCSSVSRVGPTGSRG